MKMPPMHGDTVRFNGKTGKVIGYRSAWSDPWRSSNGFGCHDPERVRVQFDGQESPRWVRVSELD